MDMNAHAKLLWYWLESNVEVVLKIKYMMQKTKIVNQDVPLMKFGRLIIVLVFLDTIE